MPALSGVGDGAYGADIGGHSVVKVLHFHPDVGGRSSHGLAGICRSPCQSGAIR